MPEMKGFFAVVLLVQLAVVGTSGAQQETAARRSSLNRCQNTLRVQGRRLVEGYLNHVGTCLQRVSTEVVQKASTDPSAAVRVCTSHLRMIPIMLGRFDEKVLAACGGASLAHSSGDVLGPGKVVAQSLQAGDLGTYCSGFGGNGTVASVEDWRNCVRTAHLCEARQALAVQYPRGREWLQAVASGVAAANPGAGQALNEMVSAVYGTTGEPQLSCGPFLSRLLVTGEIVSFGPGTDGDVRRGATLAYRDNGDGTITDLRTGLMWEKKSDDGSVHDADNTYTWGDVSFGSAFQMDGTIVTQFLSVLNTPPCFAGYCDWRIPNRRELESLIDIGFFDPAMDSVFNTACAPNCTVTTCSCTRSRPQESAYYWSSSTHVGNPVYAWAVGSFYGRVDAGGKDTELYARAVRGGF